MGLKNKFETALVNKPSVFEPLEFYCISRLSGWRGVNLITRALEFYTASKRTETLKKASYQFVTMAWYSLPTTFQLDTRCN